MFVLFCYLCLRVLGCVRRRGGLRKHVWFQAAWSDRKGFYLSKQARKRSPHKTVTCVLGGGAKCLLLILSVNTKIRTDSASKW
jgi:hypothetical protein